MATLKHYRAWFNELNVVEAPDDTERAQREERARIMAESRSTDIYYPSVADAFAELDTIPGAYEEPAEIAADLAAAQGDHDGWGGFLFLLDKAYQRHPRLPAEQKAAIHSAVHAIVPALSDLSLPWPVEAQNARDRAAVAATHAEVLTSIPIIGGTAQDAADGYFDGGKRLGEGLARRALSEGAGAADRTRVTVLRNHIRRLVTRWRESVDDEVTLRKRLPATADGLIFGYLDILERK